MSSRALSRSRKAERWLGAACSLLLQMPLPALAQASKDVKAVEVNACLAAHVNGQKLQRTSSLRAARDALFTCSRPECPPLVRADCTRWLSEVDPAIPSVIISARTPTEQVFDVSLSIDDQLVAERLDGTAIEVDPGVHTFKLQRAALAPVEQRVLIVRGEKQRLIQFELPPATPPSEPQKSAPSAPAAASAFQVPVTPTAEPKTTRPIPTLSYVLAGGALLGVASFATFAALGRSQQSDIESQACDPFCRDVDAVRTKYAIADASLALGGLAAAAAVIVYVTRPAVLVPAAQASRASGRKQLLGGVDVRAASQMATLHWGVAF